MSANEYEVPIEEILQEDADALPIKAVPVSIEGPVQVQLIGSRVASMRTITVTANADQVLGKDLRRRRAVIITNDAEIYVGLDMQQTNNEDAFLLPVDTPMEITHTDEVWAATVSATSKISVLVEQWAN